MTSRLIRYGFWAVVAVAATLIVLRTALASPSFPFRARAWMNMEGCFGLGIILALAVRAMPAGEQGESPTPPFIRSVWPGALALGLLTAAAFWRTLYFFFLSDDFVLVKAGNSSSLGNLHHLFAGDAAYGFYRPITKLSLVLTSKWAKWDPAAWHASALILHSANSILVFLLARGLCASPLAAFFAAALFSLHGTRPETAVWISGRFDLLATLFTLCGLLFFLSSLKETEIKRWVCGLAASACMVLAILSKESAYIFPLLLGLALILEGESPRKRVGIMACFLLIAAGLFVQRWLLLGGIGGYRHAGTGQALALTFSVVGALKVLLLRIWAVLFFPVNWSTPPGAGFALVTVVYLISLVWLALRRIDRRRLTFALGFLIVSALPPLHLLLIGSNLEKSRFLYLPSVGFCLLLALAVERLPGRARWIVPGAILAFNLCALEHNLNAWEYASAKAKSACHAAVNCIDSSTKRMIVGDLPPILRGVYFFGNGFQECVDMQRAGASIQVEIRRGGGATPEGDGSRHLWWDQSADELRCVDPR
mgnify:CR=1 FL=1